MIEIKIDNNTEFVYNYFNPMYIKVNNKILYYHCNLGSLDTYTLRELETDKIIICAEYKEDLLKYLLDNEACIVVDYLEVN